MRPTAGQFAVVIDSREQTPFDFSPDVRTVVGTLTSGDYSILGLEERCAVERKSLPDLVSCITTGRDRFKRELHRLRGFECRAVVVEATISDVLAHSYRSKTHSNAVLGSVLSWQVRYGVPFVWSGEHGADVTLRLLTAYHRQLLDMVKALGVVA